MKSIPMDDAGRLVLPKEVRSRLNLHGGDRFEAEVTAATALGVVVEPVE